MVGNLCIVNIRSKLPFESSEISSDEFSSSSLSLLIIDGLLFPQSKQDFPSLGVFGFRTDILLKVVGWRVPLLNNCCLVLELEAATELKSPPPSFTGCTSLKLFKLAPISLELSDII